MKKQLRTLTKLLAAVIACCLSVAVHAQTTVRGTVTDADGMPLVGATVIVITGTQPGGGTTTDANGKFAIYNRQNEMRRDQKRNATKLA